MDSELQKLAAVAIRQLQDENSKLANELVSRKEAEKLAFLMLHSGNVTVEGLESTIEDLSNKTPMELEIIKKAQEFNKAANFSAFRLGNGPEYNTDNLDPITRMLLEDI
jgi:riboflavin synthase alpha subunit